METAELRERFASSPVARLSTVRPDGGPHVVPIVFALMGETVFSAVDAKPKRSTDLQRLANVRADGAAQVVVAPPAEHPGIQALVQRFREYRDEPPSGPLLVVTVQRWTGWASTS